MIRRRQNFEIPHGDTLPLRLVVQQINSSDQLVPYPLTGCVLRLAAKESTDDADADSVFALDTAGNGIEIMDPDAGIAIITIPANATEGLARTRTNLVYDVQLSDATGRPFTISAGVLTVVPDVVRTTDGYTPVSAPFLTRRRIYGEAFTVGPYTLPSNFVEDSEVVTVNGIRYARGVDYSVVGTVVTPDPLLDNWPADALVLIDYDVQE